MLPALSAGELMFKGGVIRCPVRLSANLSLNLQKQCDEFALAMGVGLGKDRFQLIARRLP